MTFWDFFSGVENWHHDFSRLGKKNLRRVNGFFPSGEICQRRPNAALAEEEEEEGRAHIGRFPRKTEREKILFYGSPPT